MVVLWGASGVARRIPLTANPRQVPCLGHRGAAAPTPTPNWCYRLPPRLIGVTVWNFWRKVPKPLPCVWMFFVVLSRGGARGVRAAANRRDKHPPEQAAPRPCVRPWQSSRVVGAGRERLGLVSNLRLGRRRRLAEVEEALLRRIRHLPTTRGFGSACSEGAKHLEAAVLHPHLTHPTPPPPAADACRISARAQRPVPCWRKHSDTTHHTRRRRKH